MCLREESARISNSLSELQRELEEQKSDKISAIAKMTDEYKVASGHGDRSENAAFTEAKIKLNMYHVSLSQVEARLKAIGGKVFDGNYVPIGMVVVYTTVCVEVLHLNKKFIFKMYPKGISAINKGILSVDSPVGKALWLKQKGDTVVLKHHITGELIRYKIKDIY